MARDIRELIGGDVALRRMGETSGGEYAGPCPFCPGGRDRFRGWPAHPSGRGRWWCRRCSASGDAIEYVRRRDGVSFAAACRTLNASSGQALRRRPVYSAPAVEEPADAWRTRADAFVEGCADALRGTEGRRTRDYLHERGVSDPAIRDGRLGFNVRERHEDKAMWGLEGGGDVWMPPGIVMPVVGARGALLGLRIRRVDGTPKYVCISGGVNALYGAHGLDSTRPGIMVEGAFDALVVYQAAGDLVTPVATLSTSGARRPRWFAALAQAPLLLLAFDADEAGQTASDYWRGVFPRARVWPPTAGDPSDMWMRDGDVGLRRWVCQGLGAAMEDDAIEPHCERLALCIASGVSIERAHALASAAREHQGQPKGRT